MAQETTPERIARETREKHELTQKAERERAEKEAQEASKRADEERIQRDAAKIEGDYELYDIKNPTPATRVIYDGIPGSMVSHLVHPGLQKKGVKLHASIVKEMADRNKAKPNSDLIITEHAG